MIAGCRKRIRKAAGDSESSASEFEPSAESASDVSFESEADNESEDGEADVSGIYDDADLEQYNQANPPVSVLWALGLSHLGFPCMGLKWGLPTMNWNLEDRQCLSAISHLTLS